MSIDRSKLEEALDRALAEAHTVDRNHPSWEVIRKLAKMNVDLLGHIDMFVTTLEAVIKIKAATGSPVDPDLAQIIEMERGLIDEIKEIEAASKQRSLARMDGGVWRNAGAPEDA